MHCTRVVHLYMYFHFLHKVTICKYISGIAEFYVGYWRMPFKLEGVACIHKLPSLDSVHAAVAVDQLA